MSIALIVNELFTNAIKHQSGASEGPPAPVRIGCACDDDKIVVTIRNAGALPPGFDFAAGAGFGTGLTLVRALLPRTGATLSYASAADGGVETRLTLSAPVASRTRPDNQVVSLR